MAEIDQHATNYTATIQVAHGGYIVQYTTWDGKEWVFASACHFTLDDALVFIKRVCLDCEGQTVEHEQLDLNELRRKYRK